MTSPAAKALTAAAAKRLAEQEKDEKECGPDVDDWPAVLVAALEAIMEGQGDD